MEDNKIKTAIEIALEKAGMLDELTDEEKENIKNKKKLDPIMINFYRSKLQPEQLWAKLKGENESFFKLAQYNIIDSLNFNLELEELLRRIKAVIAIESLKKDQNTSMIEENLGELENLKKRADEEKNQVFNEFKSQVEKNPQARTRVLEQNGAKVVIKLSVEDAILQSQQWKQFVTDFEKNYGNAFDRIIENTRKYI